MTSYRIENSTGHVYGLYQGATPGDAVRSMVDDQGCMQSDEDEKAGRLVAVEVPEVRVMLDSKDLGPLASSDDLDWWADFVELALMQRVDVWCEVDTAPFGEAAPRIVESADVAAAAAVRSFILDTLWTRWLTERREPRA